jgi:hypothetical protein
MSRSRCIVLIVALAVLSTAAFAQFGRRRGFGYGWGFDIIQQDIPPGSEFVFARWQYAQGRGWAHDYPDAEEHLNQIMDEATGIHVERMSYRVVPIASEEIFKYPFGYISEPGQMWLSDEEVANFREFVDRGGFVMIDDFDGPRHFAIMRQNLERVFPDRPMFPIPDSHAILHTYYDIDSLYVESPYQVGGPAQFFGVNNERDELAVVICYNNDIGDFWEYIDQPMYPLKPTAEALRLGVNFVLYAMTH